MSSRGALALLVPLALGATPATAAAQGDAEAGKVVYDKWCAGCHGDTGAGDGEAAAYMLPRPRDFTRAVYQIRTTASGELPTDDDLRRVIDLGMPGTTMPAWRDRLSGTERDDIIAYLKTLSRFFRGDPPQPMTIASPPRVTEDALADGRRLYIEELQCNACHGEYGRGDGTSAPTMTDDWNFPIRPADLTKNWNFNGGGTVEDIYLRMRTGVDGTPMPSNSDVIDAGLLTEEDLWRVAQYVRSLSPEQPPNRRDVVRAALVETALPSGADDPAWDDVEPYYIPLVGQITIAPRLFNPTVDGLWVQAAHDGEALAMRITWNDPTRSPDPEWDEYFQGVMAAMTDVDGLPEAQGTDLVSLQLPATPPEGMELPYFLGGDSRRPVHKVQWTSAADEVEEGASASLDGFSPRAATTWQHASSFADGQYRLFLRRALVPADTAAAPTFVPGEPMPIAFSAADGTNGEGPVRSSVSAWYAIYLDVPTPSRVYIAPLVAVVLTAGLGLMAVWRAQTRERGA